MTNQLTTDGGINPDNEELPAWARVAIRGQNEEMRKLRLLLPLDGKYQPEAEMVLRIERDFTFHPVKDETQAQRYERIRALAKVFAGVIVVLTPKGREQSTALTNLDQVVFWANAAIARGES